MSDTLIEFKNFGFKYNAQSKPTLYDINLKINKGEKILIAGPSGCGKSTLVHCMNGLIPFSYKGQMTGSLKIKNKESSSLSLFDISKSIGTVLQDSDAQFVGMTVAEDIAFALENDCIPNEEMKSRVSDIAKLVDVDSLLSMSPAEVSGGQKQRVSMAGVMVDNVDILLFDEPLAALDPATGKYAIELIDDLQKKTDTTVIIIEHRIEDVLHRDVDRVVLMGTGRILFDGSPDELLAMDLLRNNGIREPLYITALRYAGVDITTDKLPHSLKSMRLESSDIELVKKWFLDNAYKNQYERADRQLNVSHLSYHYPQSSKEILKDVSFSVPKGEMLAIVGTNGAGKSTLAKTICGFEIHEKGDIFLDDINLINLSIKERAGYIGYIMQNPNHMISKVMIYDEVSLGLRVRGYSEEEISKKVDEVLKICGLWKFRNWPVSALSYGQKKRVTIASILVLDPKIIILDEPTAGQDYLHYTQIMEFLTKINECGITTVMITHDMHLMLEYAEWAIVFADGKIVAEDIPSNILTNEDIINMASLKRTSLYELAKKCEIEDAALFTQRFIDYEKKIVGKGVENAESL